MRMFGVGAEITNEVQTALEQLSEHSTVEVSQLTFGRDIPAPQTAGSKSASQLIAVKNRADAFHESCLRGEQDYKLL